MIRWRFEVEDDDDRTHVRAGEADSLRKAERPILRAIESIEKDLAAKVTSRRWNWYKIRRSYYYHFFWEGETKSICGLTDRRGVPESEIFELSPNADTAQICLTCRRIRKNP